METYDPVDEPRRNNQLQTRAGKEASLFDEKVSIEGAFDSFHRANPGVYELFKRFALEAHEQGRQRVGAKMIWERIRWYCQVETTETAPKLNNNYTSRYARLFLLDRPDLEHLFETRRLRGGE
tara:strand:- start:3177 stop:3545 length:369 start_codon:yes stop_codon:yes gene_type:complete